MTGKLEGKVALITGGTSGIGKATAMLFAEEGAQVAFTGRRRELGQRVATRSRSAEATACSSKPTIPKRRTASARWRRPCGSLGSIDILFNNAGIVTSGTAETTTEEDWAQTMAINVTAVWRMCRLVVPEMRKRGGGAIVNNGSDWSVVGAKDALPYTTSKGAVALMTKSMALDYAHENIRVNAVCPGDTFVERWLETGHFVGDDPVTLEEAKAKSAAYLPMKRFAESIEIARAVLFLASDNSSFVTGHLLLVDGGNTAQ